MTLGNAIVLWTGPVLQSALFVVFLRRKIFRITFPAFFRYTCFSVVAGVLQISLLDNDLWYFWVYWVDQLIYGVLAMLAMREVFQMVWSMQRGLRRFLVWAVILGLGGVAVLWGMHQPAWRSTLKGVTAAFYAFIAGVQAVEVILCGLAIWLVRRFTSYHLGIMLGFGISAIAQVLAYVGHFYNYGPIFREIIVYAPLSAYMGAAGTWLFVFLSKPKMRTRLDPDEVMRWLSEQEQIAREISADLGLKWPEKKKSKGDPRCAVHA